MFLEYFIVGAWYVSTNSYMKTIWLQRQESVMHIVALAVATMISPFFVGMIADRYFSAQKVMGVLHLAGAALVRAVQPLRHARSFALRQAVLHVARPGNQTRVILLAVGLGTFFILGVRGLQENLLRDFAVQVGENAPDMFLIDIQPDQRDALAGFIDSRNGERGPARLIPVLRARVVGVQDAK